MPSRELKVEIVGDSRSLERALGNASSSTSKFGSSFAKIGKAAAVGLGVVAVGAVAAGKKMIDLASDAAEVDTKLDVVFGKALPALTKNLEQFSEATGASRFQLREQAADMGALLAPLIGTQKGAADMSAQFVKLATDLSSFNNVPVEEALLAIRSGLVGEAEPLRRFGVLLNEAAVKAEAYSSGIAKSGAELTEQQKVLARANLIMEQTTLAQEDATNTAGSMANQMRALRNNVTDAATELGAKLIPAALAIVKAFNENWPQIEKVVDRVMEGLIDGAQQAVTAVRTHFTAIKAVAISAFQGALTAARALVSFFKTDWGQTIGLGIAAVLALKSAMGALGLSIGGVSRAMVLVARNPLFLALAGIGLLVGEVAGNFIQGKIAAMQLSEALDRASGSAQELKGSLDALKQANLSVEQAHHNQAQAAQQVREAQVAVNQAVREYGPASQQAVDAVLNLKGVLLGYEQAGLDVTESIKRQTQAEQDRSNKLSQSQQQILKLSDAARQANATFAQSQAVDNFSAAMQKAATGAQQTAFRLREVDPAASRAQAKAALMAGTAADLAEKLGRVPSRKEIIAEAKAVNFAQFYAALLELGRKVDTTASAAYSGGHRIGSNIAQGAADGTWGGLGKVQAAVNGIISAALRNADVKGASPPEHAAAQLLSKPLVLGAARGVKENAKVLADQLGIETKAAIDHAKQIAAYAQEVGWATALAAARGLQTKTPTFIQQMREFTKQGIDAAKAAVAEKQAELATAFGDMATAALAAFDAVTAAWKSPAEKLLEKMRLEDATKAVKDAVDAANAEFDRLVAESSAASMKLQALGLAPPPGMTQEEWQRQVDEAKGVIATNGPQILAAQEAVNAALRAQEIFNLEQKALKEREAYELERGNKRLRFEEELADLAAWGNKHVNKHRQIQGRVRTLLQKFGLEARGLGKVIGDKIANGLMDSIPSIIAAAQAVGQAIKDNTKGSSPTKEGPLSTFDMRTAGYEHMANFAKGMRAAAPLINRSFATVGMGAGTGGTATGGAGGMTIIVHVGGSVTSERDLVDAIHRGLAMKSKAGYGALFTRTPGVAL